MAQKLKTTTSLIEWCDQQVKDGHKLSMGWEGGGDSGWIYFMIDGQQVADSAETPEIRQLIDLMYDQLDYGSWAGEFSASGSAYYDDGLKAFTGVDNYGEDRTEKYDCDLKVRVPKHLWFDRMGIEIRDQEAYVDAAFTIRNGFLTPEHDEFLEEFRKEFADEVDEVITKFSNDPETNEYSSMWENLEMNRNEFTEEGEFLVYHVKVLSIGSRTSEEKSVYLELKNEDDE